MLPLADLFVEVRADRWRDPQPRSRSHAGPGPPGMLWRRGADDRAGPPPARPAQRGRLLGRGRPRPGPPVPAPAGPKRAQPQGPLAVQPQGPLAVGRLRAAAPAPGRRLPADPW